MNNQHYTIKAMICSIIIWEFLTMECICYAEVYTNEISINCINNKRDATWREFGGVLGTVSIISKGIREPEVQWLITDWRSREQDIQVIAKCSQSNETINLWPPGTTLTCSDGNSVLVSFMTPNDSDPRRYVFVADVILQMDKDTDQLQVVQRVNPSGLTTLLWRSIYSFFGQSSIGISP